MDYLESPWIECSTTGQVGHIQLHIQDEYSYDIKQWSSTDGFEFKAELQFADVPKQKTMAKNNDNDIQQKEY